MAVLPGFRRRGIAKALVREALRLLSERGCTRVSTLVVAEEAGAVHFLESCHDLGIGRDPAPKDRFVATRGRDSHSP
jgi:ribosomal protein S18 acetylase RimI-like enzyme